MGHRYPKRSQLSTLPLIWKVCGLEQKLVEFQAYYNRILTHRTLGGFTPNEIAGRDRKTERFVR